MEIILAQPRGFCAGVKRAIEIVERALTLYGPPIYVRHEIVHNKYVVEGLKAKGVIFIDEIREVPEDAILIFSAHGVSSHVEEEAHRRELPVIDATCPLVTKVHLEAIQSEAEGRQIVLIGHAGHPEVEGTSGRVNQDVILVESTADLDRISVTSPDKLAYVTQTTLSVDDTKAIIEGLKGRFPSIKGPGLKDICYATQNRQNAVRELTKMVDIILVIGAQNSSNSNRLRDLAHEMGTASYLIDDANSIDLAWFQGKKRVGITAGASAPETLVERIVQFLDHHFHATVTKMDGIEEHIIFKLPKEVTEKGMFKRRAQHV